MAALSVCLLVAGCDPPKAHHAPAYSASPTCDLSRISISDPAAFVRSICGLPAWITSWDSSPGRYQWFYGEAVDGKHNQIYFNNAGRVISIQPVVPAEIEENDRHEWYPPVTKREP